MKPTSTLNLDRQAFLEKLRTKQLGRTFRILGACTSTNDVAAEMAGSGAPHGCVLIAEEQTLGRGRQGRSWLSPRGGIWMTIILRGPLIIEALSSLSLVGALAIARSLDSSLSIRARVRWPNDVVVDNRKLAGVLVEAESKGNELQYALLGMGINANFPTSMLEEVSQQSTSLLDIVGSPVNRESLISSILYEIEYLNGLISSQNSKVLMGLLEQMDYSRGKTVSVRIQQGEISGVFDGYESLSKVRIATRGGTLRTVNTSAVILADYRN